jgi:hypothetical protein
MRTYHVAWWNLGNLFDEENAVALGRRIDKVFRAMKNDIAGWTPQLRDGKIDQLATGIAAMSLGHGPDLLGVCEVENRFVVDRLVEQVNATLPTPCSYAVVHADTGDARGIDVAFIYDDTLFQVPLPLAESVFFHVVMRRNVTRKIVQVNLKPPRWPPGPWAVFGNHWPSRSGGQFESEGYRAIAGETLSNFHQRVLEVHGPQTAVHAMGDFNDEPFDTSWFDTHSAPDSEPRSQMRGRTRFCGISCSQTRVCPMAASISTTSPTCSISSWSTRTWPPAARRSRSTRARPDPQTAGHGRSR